MADMAPGFRFYPTEEELVSFYLQNKLQGRQDLDRVIPVLYIYHYNPWDLPQFAGERCRRDPEQWFFFIPRQDKEARGGRPNRLTTSGYWKAIGSPGYKTMVFYRRAPQGRKAEWKMNESGPLKEKHHQARQFKLRPEFSLCRVYEKSKSLRAFDRRPSPEVPATGQEAMVHQVIAHHGTEATTSHQNCPTMERTGSPESSSDEDHPNPSKTVRSDNLDMDIGNEPLWDWEHLNWF
ncbi:NAC domain-containing protein 90 [Camellia lanceoleosa]|uniref:NAC domain-containing protein 90 n=1 Tax=Camellia lanceoleosa TaxID=1840588 RepID=A0ACC0GEU1_9ERIC|nr:NAC domain-containing protein 90 [Camellia lanceoleosa]